MSSFGHTRERQVKAMLELDGWWVARAAGSLGDADLVALRATEIVSDGSLHGSSEAMLIEVKATAAGPYSHFGPDDREQLHDAAVLAGAEAWLCWWPKRHKPEWIEERKWP